MKRNLIVLNVALLAVVGLLGWMLRQRWLAAQEHERQVKAAKVKAPIVLQPPPLKKVGPLDGPAYGEVATKNLFSQDRNSVPVPDPPPKPPPPPVMPPLPVVHGVFLWGDVPPTVMMSERGKEQKAYHPGDKIGEFKLISVSNKEITLEWNGKEMTKSLDELMQKALFTAQNNSAPGATGPTGSPAASPTATAANTAPSASAPTNASADPGGGVKSLSEGNGSSSMEGVPGKDVGGGIHTCVAGDTSPPGTVSGNLKKLVNTTPFGVTCRWEPIK